jgi:hypothetical protein
LEIGMTALGAGILAGAALLGILIVVGIVIGQDGDDEDDVNLQEYDDWERLRGPSPGERSEEPSPAPAQPQGDGDRASSGVAFRRLRPAA